MLLSGDFVADGKKLRAMGFTMIGYSAFESAEQNLNGAKRYGEYLGAEVVVVSEKFSHTVTNSYTVQEPVGESTTDYSGSEYDSDGYSSYSGTATTTHTATVEKEYDINRYDYVATYWVRRHFVLGVGFSDPSDELRRRLGTNKGVVLTYVVKGSPAFKADLMAEDILMEVNGEAVYGVEGASELVGRSAGREAELTVIRGAKTLHLTVMLNAP